MDDHLIDKLTAPLAPDTGARHEFDPRSAELKSKARLTVLPDPGALARVMSPPIIRQRRRLRARPRPVPP